MHDIKDIIQNTNIYIDGLKARNSDTSLIDSVLEIDKLRKELIQFVEGNKSEIKKLSKEVGNLKKNGEDATSLMCKVSDIKKSIEDKNRELEDVQNKMNSFLSVIPNIPFKDVPVGKDESENKEIKKWGEIKKFNFETKDHVALGENLLMLDFEAGAKITGSRFVVYKGLIARLERALINFMLDEHNENGYEEIIPPFIVNKESMYGTGQLPKFEEDLFKIENFDWYLTPTAEVPLTNIKRDTLFQGKELPFKYCSYTPCFRSEAGSYGKDARGLIRLHQFNKVELVNIVAEENSEKAHQDMVDRACSILEKLELPYRAMLLCTGDMGFGAKKCVDLEVWLPGQNTYREISSISNCGSFQARRAKIRYRNTENRPTFAHTLNGSGLAVGRTVVAIMENYQQEDGTILIPTVLQKYISGLEVISR